MKILVLLLSFTFFIFMSSAQKPMIDSSVYGRWPTLGDAEISNNGKYVFYWINNQPLGNQTLMFCSTSDIWNFSIPNIPLSNCSFTQDSRKAIVRLPGDSLAIISLGKTSVEYIANVKSFKIAKCIKRDWLAYELSLPHAQCVITNLQTTKSFLQTGVRDYTFCERENGILLEFSHDSLDNLLWFDLNSGRSTNIWRGVNSNLKLVKHDEVGKGLVFIVGDLRGDSHSNEVWHYKFGDTIASLLASDTSRGIKKGFSITARDLNFSRDGRHVFFDLKKNMSPGLEKKMNQNLNIWNYKDKYLQSMQISGEDDNNSILKCCADLSSHRVVNLNKTDEKVILFETGDNDKYVLLYKIPLPDDYYKPDERPSVFLESIDDGARKLVTKHYNFSGFRNEGPLLSPDEKFIVWFDSDSLVWYSYCIGTGVQKNLSQLISENLYDGDALKAGRHTAYGLGGWLADDSRLFIYDQYDVWEVDPKGILPANNITHFFGRQQHVVFGLVNPSPYDLNRTIRFRGDFLLSGFNRDSKESGFWSLNLYLHTGPAKLIMEPCANWVERSGIVSIGGLATTRRPLKAQNADVYVVTKMSASRAPNLFITNDFKLFRNLSWVFPEEKYNWLQNELISWKTNGNQTLQGILYKPENFDSTRKYPLIFSYYEKRSDELNSYINPDYSRDRINIPSYVSNGYLVFIPDIYYCSAKNGIGVLNSIVSAARYLISFPWVDSTKMGLQGHSFAGWETNFLVTHSHLFAAACEASGVSDLVSAYNELQFRTGLDRQKQYELEGQGSAFGVGVTPWTSAQSYIDNSPVFFIDSITTPLLMMQCRQDSHVPFEQAIELFLGMKRAGKRVWLLDYPEGSHSLWGNEAKDFTARMQQFFDHYLKGAPAPIWMTRGVPASIKGIDNGLELDNTGAIP